MIPILQDILQRLAWNLPFLVVMAIGLWMCIKYKENHIRFSRLVSTAFIIFIVGSLFSILNHAWFASVVSPLSTQSRISIASIYAVTSGLSAVLDLVGWLFLLRAVHSVLNPNNGAQAA